MLNYFIALLCLLAIAPGQAFRLVRERAKITGPLNEQSTKNWGESCQDEPKCVQGEPCCKESCHIRPKVQTSFPSWEDKGVGNCSLAAGGGEPAHSYRRMVDNLDAKQQCHDDERCQGISTIEVRIRDPNPNAKFSTCAGSRANPGSECPKYSLTYDSILWYSGPLMAGGGGGHQQDTFGAGPLSETRCLVKVSQDVYVVAPNSTGCPKGSRALTVAECEVAARDLSRPWRSKLSYGWKEINGQSGILRRTSDGPQGCFLNHDKARHDNGYETLTAGVWFNDKATARGRWICPAATSTGKPSCTRTMTAPEVTSICTKAASTTTTTTTTLPYNPSSYRRRYNYRRRGETKIVRRRRSRRGSGKGGY